MDRHITLPSLNLPTHPLKLRQMPDGTAQVYDPLRLKWLILTPEEHVRQRFVAYLTYSLGYPGGMMANEVALRLNDACADATLCFSTVCAAHLP